MDNFKKPHEDMREIRIRFRPKTLERLILISMVVLLAGYILVDNIFFPCKCGVQEDLKKVQTTTTTMATVQTATTENVTADTEETVEEETPPEEEETTPSEEEAAPDSVEPAATLTFGKDNVELDGAKIEKITFKITNQADAILRARVDASWYDASDESLMKDKVCGTLSVLVPSSSSKTTSMNDFSRSYTNAENSKETLTLKLYESTTDKLLDEKTVIINT